MKWFWNEAERRVRAPWRLLLHGVMLLLFFGLFTAAGSILDYILGHEFDEYTLSRERMVLPAGTLLRDSLLALVASVLATWIAARYLDRRSFADLGLRITRLWWGDLSFGLLSGLFLVAAGFVVKLQMGWVEIAGLGIAEAGTARFFGEFLAIGVASIAVGIYEEIIIRGYQMTNLAEAFNTRFFGAGGAILGALGVTSLFFALLHLFNPGMPGPFGLVNIALISLLFLGLSYALTGSLAIAIGLHISWNFAMSFIFGLPVSGVVIGSTSLLVTEDVGPEVWTGGAFGLEGGLLGTIAIVGGLLALLAWVRLRRGRIALYTDIARPPQRKPGQRSGESSEPQQGGGEREE